MLAHDPYIIWLPRTRKPIARCRLCDWYATTTHFQAAAQHLIYQGEEPWPNIPTPAPAS